jgi:hypothetical protein
MITVNVPFDIGAIGGKNDDVPFIRILKILRTRRVNSTGRICTSTSSV